MQLIFFPQAGDKHHVKSKQSISVLIKHSKSKNKYPQFEVLGNLLSGLKSFNNFSKSGAGGVGGTPH